MSRPPLSLIPGDGPGPGVLRLRGRVAIHTVPAPRPALYDRTAETVETVALFLTPQEVALIVGALTDRGRGNSLRPGSQDHVVLARKVRVMVDGRHPSFTDTDSTPAHGTPRPGAS